MKTRGRVFRKNENQSDSNSVEAKITWLIIESKDYNTKFLLYKYKVCIIRV
mgnify:CR=1 FL=1